MKRIALLFFYLVFAMAFSQVETDTQWKNHVNQVFQGMDKNRGI